MSTEDRIVTQNPEETFTDLLAYIKLLNTPRLAHLYIYILQNELVTVETIKMDLQLAYLTIYEYIEQLEEMSILTRHTEEAPTTMTVSPIYLQISTNHGDIVVTPTFVNAVRYQLDIEDIRTFVEQEGIAKLAAALHYTLQIIDGDLTQQTATEKLDINLT